MPPQTIPLELFGRPFLLAEAKSAGLTAQVLRGRRFRRLFCTAYVVASAPDSLATKVDALRLLLPPDALLSHETAALLRGLPIPPPDRLHVTVPPGVRGPRLAGVCTHRGSPAASTREGRRLTAPADNFLELAETLSLVDLVILGDAMVGMDLLTCAELVDAVARTSRRRGVRMARRAAALVRPRVDSPMETRLRLLIVFAGLPEPTTNFTVRDGDGGWIGVVDLAYDAIRIAIEYHGDVHRGTPGKWRSDIAKAELLYRLGWRVIILTADDIYLRPAQTLRRVCEALVDAHHPGVPADLDPAWRQHFGRDDQLTRTGQQRAVS